MRKHLLSPPLAKQREREREREIRSNFSKFKPLIYGDIREITHSFCKNFAKNNDFLVYVGNSVTRKLFLLL